MAPVAPVKCGKCKTMTACKQILQCRECKHQYCLNCAGVDFRRYYIMTAEAKSCWKCRACYAKLPPYNTVKKSVSPLPPASSVNEILSTLDRSNVTIRSKQVPNLDDSTVENNVISELVMEMKALREQVTLLNNRLGEVAASVDRCHDKIDSCNEKLVGMEKQIQNHDLTHNNQTLSHCDQNSDNSTNNIVVKPQPKRPKRKLAPPLNTSLGTNRNTSSPSANSDIPVRPSSNIDTTTETNSSSDKATNNSQEPRDGVVYENKSNPIVIEADDDDGETKHGPWIDVMPKKRRNQSQRCTAGPNITTLKAVEANKIIHLWNMASGPEEVLAYLKTLCPTGKCTVDELKPRGDYKSYKIMVPEVYYDKCLSIDVWPVNARVKPWTSFRHSRKNFRQD
ncbi:hypothetical protein NE865_00418 [Phthorimaea operculella]|nr:hypothetical protein NE865_00418 [Phthorimaea operculella]